MGTCAIRHLALVFLLLVNFLWEPAFAFLNLYLKQQEVRQLLGLETELYYVRNGEVNHYALGFMVPVPANISDLHFTWQSLISSPLSYTLGISVSDPKALGTPRTNISHRGIVPVEDQVFQVVLPCTGVINAEVEVNIQVNITNSETHNTTSLILKRKKFCLRDEGINGTFLADASAMVASTSSFYIAVGCAIVLIIIITSIAMVCYIHTQKIRNTEALNYGGSTSGLASKGQTFLRVDTPNNASTTGSYSSFRRLTPLSVSVPVQVNDLRACELTEQISEIAVERRKVVLHEKMQEGTFGQIFRATLIEDENEINGKQHVFVKTVSDQASQIQVSLLLSEGMMMFAMNHKNILPVIAACTDSPQPLLAYPYMNQGNLKRFLQKCKFSSEGHVHTLLTQDLVAMAIQIVQGMIYLHKKKVVHRDLATRNCVVDDRLVVKITDNALSRDLFPNDYHCLGDNENRPVKWLALESLLKKDFSPASDVWAFGVTVWELMTLGQQPYLEIDPFEMGAYLRDGYRLSQPINCPDELFALMACCWAIVPEDRPSFPQLMSCLQNFYTALGRYI